METFCKKLNFSCKIFFNNIDSKLLLLICTVLSFSCGSYRNQGASNTVGPYDRDSLEVLYNNRSDSTLWNQKMLEGDLDFEEEIADMNFPIKIGTFPVPEYSSPGNGNRNDDFKAGKKDITVVSTYVNKGHYNEHAIPKDKSSQVIITIACLTDDMDLTNPTFVTSRNHPNYICEGTIHTSKNNIDWVTIHTIDGDSYAIINMRLFDLTFGRTILVAPQKDGSFRFLQMQSEFLSSEDLEGYIKELKNDSKTLSFFNKPGNI